MERVYGYSDITTDDVNADDDDDVGGNGGGGVHGGKCLQENGKRSGRPATEWRRPIPHENYSGGALTRNRLHARRRCCSICGPLVRRAQCHVTADVIAHAARTPASGFARTVSRVGEKAVRTTRSAVPFAPTSSSVIVRTTRARCYVGLVAVGIQEQAEDTLVLPLLRNCLTLMTFPFL